MKKYFIAIAILALGLVSTASAQTYTFSYDLSVGASGNDVTNLQTTLINKGFDIPAISSGISGKGYFGSQTRMAVARYQASMGLPNTGYVGPLTRGKLNGGNSNTSPITVTSPNGNESWQLGSNQTISWKTSGTSNAQGITIYLIANLSGCFNLKPGYACLPVLDPKFTIASGVSNNGSYNWNVGTYSQNDQNATVSPGNYFIKICKLVDGYDDKNKVNYKSEYCDVSDSTLTISSTASLNRPPVISGIDAPSTLSINQSGTWTIRALDPENSQLSYAVDWGDVHAVTNCDPIPVGYNGGPCPQPGPSATRSPFVQNAAFTHTYSASGTYTVKFTVQDNVGNQAQSSVTVLVGAASASTIKVLSPNGGEKWTINSTYPITWQINGNSNFDSKVDIYITQFQACPHAAGLPDCYTLAATLDKNISSNVVYNWIAGTDISNAAIPRGIGYKIQVCLAGSTIPPGYATVQGNCDSSDAPFALLDQAYENNKVPVISNILGPTTASVGQSVTYNINAYDPEGGPVSYQTYWIKGQTQGGLWQNNTTNFPSIAFPESGTYTVHTIVTDNVGKTAVADLIVNVQ